MTLDPRKAEAARRWLDGDHTACPCGSPIDDGSWYDPAGVRVGELDLETGAFAPRPHPIPGTTGVCRRHYGVDPATMAQAIVEGRFVEGDA